MTLREELIHIAAQSTHKEVCGVIDTSGIIHKITNVSSFANSFIFDKIEYKRILTNIAESGGTVYAVYHSHLSGPPELSQADITMMRRLKVHFVIISGKEVRCINHA